MAQVTNKTIDDYFLLTVIGKGCYGKILLVKEKKTQKVYAMKVLKKKLLAEQNKIQTIFTQRNLLIEFDHPYIINILESFQNQKKMYFVLQYCPGGQLYNLLSIKQKFTQEQTKFYIAQVILALRYIHKKDIVYRDLKPQNILIDKQGYIKLTDFGLSKKLKKNQINTFSLSGMPEYMAPEILRYQDCSRAVDFWCLGSLLYQMVTGLVPFYSQNQNQLYQNIKSKDFIPDKESNLSDACIELLNKLFIKDPKNRFGMNSQDQIEKHPWFQGINWDAVYNKKYRAPFVPILEGQDDTSYFDQQITQNSITSASSFDQSYSNDIFTDDSKFQGFDFHGSDDQYEKDSNKGSLEKKGKKISLEKTEEIQWRFICLNIIKSRKFNQMILNNCFYIEQL